MALLRHVENYFGKIFPKHWNVQEDLADKMCRNIKANIFQIMSEKKATLDSATLKRALKKTLIFERELMNSFGTTPADGSLTVSVE